MFLQALLQLDHAITETDMRREVAAMEMPTLVIHGAKDKSTPPRLTGKRVAAMMAKGAMPPLVPAVVDCRAAYDRLRSLGAEFTQEPVDRYGTVDAAFRDPSGNGWKMIEARQ